MINITSQTVHSIEALDGIIRGILDTDVTGCSVSNYSAIHLVDGVSASKQSQAQKIFDNWDNLSPIASVSSMVVGDADPTITQSSSDSDLAYVVLLNSEIYSTGTVSVLAGMATLTLVDPEAGIYDTYFARTSGNFASGHSTITVTES